MTERLRISWAHFERRLEQARNYWVSTVRPDGRPHAAPVWGVWVDGQLWFGTDPSSVKARNLAANPAVAVHLDSADDVLVVEGSASRRTGVPPHVDAAYAGKYVLVDDGQPCHLGDPLATAPVWTVRPRTALTWLELAFPATMTRWRFTDGATGPTPEEISYG